jgi:zinc protease
MAPAHRATKWPRARGLANLGLMPRTRAGLGPVERAVLANGLGVVVVPEPAATLVGVSVVYNVGFRSEPEGRTGFAHLFEHMMFQGSAHVDKMGHMRTIESAGGIVNGHTRADVTAYYEAVPSAALELALYLEADRMAALALTEENLRNQVAVVKEEIRRNVLNQPYGGFPWIPLPALAFRTYPNAHNGYGDFSHLEQATVEDGRDFYKRYYNPANAVLAVVGGCRTEEVVSLAERHFGAIRGRRRPKHGPWTEPALTSEKHQRVASALVPQPAFAIGYRTPDPVGDLKSFLPYFMLAELLAGGEASRLRRRLLHQDKNATDVSASIGTFGDDAFMVRDPTLLRVVVHHPGQASTEKLLGAVNEEVEALASEGPRKGELERAVASFASSHWKGLAPLLHRCHIVGSVETVQGRAELLSELPDLLAAVAPAQVTGAAEGILSQHRAVYELVAERGK